MPVRPTPVGGRLGIFWPNWTILEDPFVTNILKTGYKLPIAVSPPLTTTPQSRVYAPDQQLLLADSIHTLLRKQAIETVLDPQQSPGFYSPILLVPKKDSLLAKLAPRVWLASLDLQDAYLHVPIYHHHRKYLRFFFKGSHYQWKMLPFGISTAPWLFTRITSPITWFLHLRGIDFDPYIDDCLMNHLDPQLLHKQMHFAIRLLQLGWIINMDKSHLELSQELMFVGGLFLTHCDLVRIPLDRWRKIVSFASPGLSQPLVLREWQSLLGLLTSAQDLMLRGRLMLRPLQRFLLPYIQTDDLQLRFLLPLHLHAYLHASLQGWGAHLNDQTTSGLWSATELGWHINNLELQAVILAVRHWMPLLRNTRLLIASDNSTVVWLIHNQGTTRSKQLLEQTFQLTSLLDNNGITRAKDKSKQLFQVMDKPAESLTCQLMSDDPLPSSDPP
ncbi:uncharacterized protein LOC124260221 [Haliotis rubra]|uniref:uncharacterized protein LOC124260221 n=1 Tax=Haliotis rubra TaxID=36100 RepID=UPI001EE595D3|nr:uncharacterized protein LOC124260221 [Haliotis rubra]